MKNSILIDALGFGAAEDSEGITLENLQQRIVQKRGKPLSSSQLAFIQNIFNECFAPPETTHGNDKRHLKLEYYFKQAEYQERQASLAASTSANKTACIAFGVSMLAIIVVAALGFTQLTTPVHINKSDFKALVHSNTVQREMKLDPLQMAQILSAIGHDQTDLKVEKPEPATQSREVTHHELINRYFEEE